MKYQRALRDTLTEKSYSEVGASRYINDGGVWWLHRE